MKLNYIKCIFFILASVFTGIAHSHALSLYGVLKGDSVIDYKSPVNGVVDILNCTPGLDYSNINIFKITSIDGGIKKEILKMKFDKLKNEYKLYKNEYESAKDAFNEGLIAKSELSSLNRKMQDTIINLKELENEINTLNHIDKLSNPYLNGRFICQDVFVSLNSYVNAGDVIAKIEMLNKYNIEIKYDPVTTNIKRKLIKYRSLVNNSTGSAKLIATKSLVDSSGMGGLKLATLELEDNGKLSPELLNTAFEITFHDKIEH
ncbi:ABC transporter [Escherichia coli]|uniref:ABC transporter n=1 Tax=Escherichia coli TaxID=562 RepID=UPI000943E2E2|nr:ABC transporter [Escherichia coli]OKU67215.1 ABC transporter [Escherichia coli]OKU80164.1 ABC transporter [Escherichia coli]OKW43783.1 ABC transporter [Escherichia coli]OKW54444.1 ABC transporter [Escherichia coli]